MKIVSLAVHVLTSVHQEQSLKATSILSTQTLAQSAEHALMYVRRRLSVFPPKVRLISERNKGFDWGVSLQCKGAPFIFFLASALSLG